MRAESLLDQSYANAEQMIRQGMSQRIAGRTLSDEQKKIIELAPIKLVQVMRRGLNWQTLHPIFLGIYSMFSRASGSGGRVF